MSLLFYAILLSLVVLFPMQALFLLIGVACVWLLVKIAGKLFHWTAVAITGLFWGLFWTIEKIGQVGLSVFSR